MWLKLTLKNGDPVLVNMDRAESITRLNSPDGVVEKALIHMPAAEFGYVVQESLETIFSQLEEF